MELPHTQHDGDRKTGRSYGVVGVLLALFFLALIPYVASYVVHHPDERHYTDAAIAMIETGDYLLRGPEGAYRFRKPILSYWCVAASYQLLGINPLASRLPFLVAGGLVVWLTYRLAAMISGDRKVAILAAVVMMGHPILVISSTRSIPDILLCLFLLQSAHGFLRLHATDGADRRAYWAAYLGCGLGVASKGLPALAFLLYAWAFIVANPWQRTHWRKLVHLPSMVTGGLLAFGWFAVIYLVHGQSALDIFWSDQVKERVTGYRWMPLVQFPLFIALCGLCFLPWVLPIAVRSRQVWKKVACGQAGQLQATRFIVLWTLTFSTFAALVSKFSTRYVLPVAPLLAVLLAMALTHVDMKRLRPWLRVGLASAALFLVVLAAAVTVISLQLGAGPLDTVLAVVLASTGVLLAVHGIRGSRVTAAVCLTTLVYLAFPLSFLGIRHFALPDQGAQLAHRLQSTQAWQNQAVHIVGKPALASKIRVCTGGQVQLSRSEPSEPFPVRGQPVVIVSEDDLSRFDVRGYDLHPGSIGLKDLAVKRCLGALIRGKLADYLHQRRQRHIIAFRNKVAAPVRLADHIDTQLR